MQNRWLWLTMVPAVAFAACGSNDAGSDAGESAPAPPSIAGGGREPASQIIRLTEVQAQTLQLQTHVLRRERFSYIIRVPGEVDPAPENLSIVSAPVNGRIVRIAAHEGETVRKGDLLAELESLEFANLVAEYMQARAEEKYQKSQRDRLQVLVEKKISPLSRLERAEAEYSRALATANATESRLHAVGVSEAELRSWDEGNHAPPRLRIRSPISGAIDEHLIDMGQAVMVYQKMLSIVNLERVLVRGFVAPEDGVLLQPGDSLKIGLKEYGDLVKWARITTINPALDAKSRSVTFNVLVDTPDRWPKPGQSVRLDVQVTLPEPVLALPLSAVEYEGRDAMIFLLRDSLTVEKRRVQLSKVTGNAAIIESGVREGERVVINNIFALKALSKFEEFAE